MTPWDGTGPPGPLEDLDSDPRLRAVRERVEAAGPLPNLYRSLAHAPFLLEGWVDFAWSLRLDAASERGVRELVIMRKAHLAGADYEWRHHWEMAVAAGVPEAKLRAVPDWEQSAVFSGPERAALAMTDELSAGGRLSGTTWSALAGHFDAREAVELVVTAAFYSCVSQILAALEVGLEERYATVPAVPAPRPAPAPPTLRP